MAAVEPQSANDYDDRTSAAVKSVLVEIGQTLGSFEGKFALVGGAVPWLLLSESDMRHIGTADVDLSLDAEALGDGEYAQLVESLQEQGYNQREDMRRFQLVRTVPARDGGSDIDIIVDFLMPRDVEIAKNIPPLIDKFEKGYLLISGKFRDVDDFGPTSVRQFVEGSDALGERTADQWQQDAFGQVNAWLTAIGLRGGP